MVSNLDQVLEDFFVFFTHSFEGITLKKIHDLLFEKLGFIE